LLTALPSLGKDDRIAALTEKLGSMKGAESSSLANLNTLERDLLTISLIWRKLEAVDSTGDEAKKLSTQLDQQYSKTAESEEALRVSLTGLVGQCN
jgi:hypothetical protein